jgi:hypothetical protein
MTATLKSGRRASVTAGIASNTFREFNASRRDVSQLLVVLWITRRAIRLMIMRHASQPIAVPIVWAIQQGTSGAWACRTQDGEASPRHGRVRPGHHPIHDCAASDVPFEPGHDGQNDSI